MVFNGKDLKKIRLAQKQSASSLAKALGISVRTIYNWENGTSNPSRQQIIRLAKILNISINKLIDSSDKQSDSELLMKHASTNWKLILDEFKNSNSNIRKGLSLILEHYTRLNSVSTLIAGIFASLDFPVYVKNINNRYVMVNIAFLKNLKLDAKYRYVDKTDNNFFSKIDAEKNFKEDFEVLTKGDFVHRENYIPGTRKKRWGLISKVPVYDEDSKIIGVVGSFIDITERKIEEERRKVLEYILNNIEEGVWFLQTDIVGRKNFYINPAIVKGSGIKAEDFYKDPFVFTKHIHSDFIDSFKEYYYKREDYPRQIDYKIVKPADKSEVWIRETMYKEGNLLFGIAYNITEEKNKHEINDILKTSMDAALYGVSIIDFNLGEYMYINDACLAIYSRSREEMMKGGYNFWTENCVYGKDKEYFKNLTLKQKLIGHYPSNQTVKYKIIRPDGQIRLIKREITITEFKGRTCALCIEHDITE